MWLTEILTRVLLLGCVGIFNQASSSFSRVFCGPDPSPHVLPHYARTQSGLERGAVRGGSVYEGLRLGSETGDRPHTMGCRHRRWSHIWGSMSWFTLLFNLLCKSGRSWFSVQLQVPLSVSHVKHFHFHSVGLVRLRDYLKVLLV